MNTVEINYELWFICSAISKWSKKKLAYRRTEQISHRLAARRETILVAARDIVTERGFHSLNMQLVADLAGVAIGTLYRYFPSKSALCEEIVTDISERELSLLKDITLSDGPPLERLWLAVNSFSRRALQARTLAYALMAEPVEPGLDQLRIHYRALLAKAIADLVKECVKDGVLPAQDADATAAFMVGAFIEGVIGPHAPQLQSDGKHFLADAIASFCLRGAGVRSRSLALVEGRHAGGGGEREKSDAISARPA